MRLHNLLEKLGQRMHGFVAKVEPSKPNTGCAQAVTQRGIVAQALNGIGKITGVAWEPI